MNSPEEIPYKTFARKETHPARLGALARLHGVSSASCEHCSVFEIGCGDGGNIIPLAALYPDSRYVGIDRSATLIEKGRAEIRELGLSNIELIEGDISSFRPDQGAFDYVICHGVYSWVSAEVRRAILQRGVTAMAPQGVFFVSYNTLPGWRQRGAVRDIMRVGASLAGDASDDRSKVEAALSFLSLAARSATGSNPYLREAAERLPNSEPSYLLQEFLGEHNTAFKFTHFMEEAQAAGLQFMSEARVSMMSDDDLSPEARELLASLGEDPIRREQALDMLRNRTFRETLLCHASLAIDRGMSSGVFRQLIFVANYLPRGAGEDAQGERVRFMERFSGREVLTPAGECATVLGVIAGCGAKGATLHQIEQAAAPVINLSEYEMMRVLVTLWKSGFVEAVTSPLGGMGDRAHVTALARSQAVKSPKVTSILHESFALSDVERRALALLDKPVTFAELQTLLIDQASESEAAAVVSSLSEKGFFL